MATIPVRPTAVVLLVGLLLAPPAGAAEESFGVSPAELVIDGAQTGVSYRDQVEIQNEFDSETTVTLNLSGEVGAWTTLGRESGFTMEPRSRARINVTVEVPEDAVNGTYEGKLHLTADEKDQPNGSGASIRHSVSVLLNATVGGKPQVEIGWQGVRAQDVEVGSPPQASVQVVNQGNVRTDVEAEATVFPLSGRDSVAQARANERLIPGEQSRLAFTFDTALSEGTYRVRVQSTGPGVLDENATFNVVPPGALGKDGVLRFFEVPSKPSAGHPVEVQAVFENTGNTTIASAKATGKVLFDGQTVAVIESDALVVRPGDRTNLTAFFTPDEPGRYVVEGHVVYDGFRTVTKSSFVEVTGNAGSTGPLEGQRLWIAIGVAGAVLGGLWVYRRGD